MDYLEIMVKVKIPNNANIKEFKEILLTQLLKTGRLIIPVDYIIGEMTIEEKNA